MDRTRRHRSVVTLATTLACLALMTSPASATTDTYTPTGGTLTTTGTYFTLTTTFGATGGAGCTSTIQTDTTGTTSGTINITTFSITDHFTLNGVHYVTNMFRTASSSGTWEGVTSGFTTSMTVTVRMQIRQAADQSSTNIDCIPSTTGTLLCTLAATLHLGGTFANGHLSTVSTTVHLATITPAHVTLAIGTCQVPFLTFNGGTITATSLTSHQTA